MLPADVVPRRRLLSFLVRQIPYGAFQRFRALLAAIEVLYDEILRLDCVVLGEHVELLP